MPLKRGSSQKTIGSNIRELTQANKSKSPGKKRPRKQIVAIALNKAGKSKPDRAKMRQKRKKAHG